MQINHNITALRTQNALNKANAKADKHMRNLSSGLRINTAADDAAGMAIANKMKTQVKGLKRASMNAEDGISLVETAEGALGEVHSMLQRMRELAVQAANGTLEAEDRRAIQQEVEQLKEEITNTSELTEFNKITLLNGELDRRSFTDNENVSTVAYVSDTVQPGKYAYTVSSVGTQAKVEGITSTYTGGMGGLVSINGEEAEILATDTVEEAFEKMRDVCERVGITLTRDNEWGTENGGKLYLETMESGSDQSIEILGTSTLLLECLGLVTTENELIPKATGTDAVVNLIYKSDSNPEYGFDTTATVSTQGNRVVITDSNYQKIYIDLSVDEDGDALKNGTQVVASAGVTHISGVTPTLPDERTGFNYILNGKTDALNDYVIEFKESTTEVTQGGSPKVELDDTNKKIVVTAYDLDSMTASDLQDSINLAITSKGVTMLISSIGLVDGTKTSKISGGKTPFLEKFEGLDISFMGVGERLDGYVVEFKQDSTAVPPTADIDTANKKIIVTTNDLTKSTFPRRAVEDALQAAINARGIPLRVILGGMLNRDLQDGDKTKAIQSGKVPTLANAGGFKFEFLEESEELNGYVIKFEEDVTTPIVFARVETSSKEIVVKANNLQGLTAAKVEDVINNAIRYAAGNNDIEEEVTIKVSSVATTTSFTLKDGDITASISGGVDEVAEAAPGQISLGGIDLKLNSAIGSGLNGFSFRIVEATKKEIDAITNTTAPNGFGQITTAKAGDAKWAVSGNIITIYATDISELKGKEIEKGLSGAIVKVLTDNHVKKPVDEDGNVLDWDKVNVIDVTMQTAASKFNEKLNDLTRIAATDENGTQGKLVTSEFVEFNVLDAGPLQLQVGANEGMKLEVQIPELTAAALGLEFINLRTEESAGHAITLCDEAIAEISAVRSKLGAYQNRLEYTISNLDVTEENTTAALSRIEDADMAYEMAEYTQRNIISQAGVSMLAQANQRPQQILQLLQ